MGWRSVLTLEQGDAEKPPVAKKKSKKSGKKSKKVGFFPHCWIPRVDSLFSVHWMMMRVATMYVPSFGFLP